MRFFLFLAAALVVALNAERSDDRGPSYKFPDGFPDGTVITFYIRHKGNENKPESIGIDFFDQRIVSIADSKKSDRVHLRLDRDWYKPVESNTFLNGRWQIGTIKEQPYDWIAYSNGCWRLDVIKLDSYRLNVFFLGFWSDVRTFEKSLDNTKSVYVSSVHNKGVVSDFLDVKNTKIQVKMPNDNIVPFSKNLFFDFIDKKNFNVARKLATVNKFPIGSKFEIVAMLRSSAGSGYKLSPALYFVPSAGRHKESYFMKIFQTWTGTWSKYVGFEWIKTHMLHFDGYNQVGESKSCTSLDTMPNGDLLTLTLSRRDQHTVLMSVVYKKHKEMCANSELNCQLELSSDASAHLDKPFDIMSTDGALIFHLDYCTTSDCGREQSK